MTNLELFQSEKYKNAEQKLYSIAQLSEATGIPKAILKLAKKKNFPGFGSNQRINWGMLKPEFEKRYDELISAAPDDIATLKAELAKRDIKIKDLQIKKLERNLMEPEEVKELLVAIATNFSAATNKVFSELPPHLTGKTEPEIKQSIDQSTKKLYEVFADAISKIK